MSAIERDYECGSENEFFELLRWWSEKTDEATIGDPENFGGKPWIRVTIGDVPCHLNADTRRKGIDNFVRSVVAEGGANYSVVTNARGRANKVAVGQSKQVWPFFYLYTDREVAGPREL